MPSPAESAIRTLREVRPERNTGRARKGLQAMLSSSRHMHKARAGGRATRKFAEMSRASRVVVIWGRWFVRNEGTAFGVFEEPMSKCVVAIRCNSGPKENAR